MLTSSDSLPGRVLGTALTCSLDRTSSKVSPSLTVTISGTFFFAQGFRRLD
ncbi:hypothetical protein DSO57_1029867 [Entomophthora muscae]|uniref:Uncharacterized protein n=1 Tax=Entomophthora muscae TaxID=34485 RepID=A0ACC2SDQ0_9FUNG|nr:hypothetical protein DSO57_1029867 [Entomophthora muscae]